MAVSYFTWSVLLIFPLSVDAKCGSRVIAHDKQDSVNMTFQWDNTGGSIGFLEHFLQESSLRVELAIKHRNEWEITKRDKLQIQSFQDGEVVVILYHPGANDAGVYKLTTKPICSIELIVIRKPVVSLKNKKRRMSCEALTTSKPNAHNLTMLYGWSINGGFFNRSTSPFLPYNALLAEREITCTATEDLRCDEFLKTFRYGGRISRVLSNKACANVIGSSTSYMCYPNQTCPCRSVKGCRYGRCVCEDELTFVEGNTVTENVQKPGEVVTENIQKPEEISTEDNTVPVPTESLQSEEVSKPMIDEEDNGWKRQMYIAIGGVTGVLIISGLVFGATFLW